MDCELGLNLEKLRRVGGSQRKLEPSQESLDESPR
jgi:hypothetical protein